MDKLASCLSSNIAMAMGLDIICKMEMKSESFLCKTDLISRKKKQVI